MLRKAYWNQITMPSGKDPKQGLTNFLILKNPFRSEKKIREERFYILYFLNDTNISGLGLNSKRREKSRRA